MCDFFILLSVLSDYFLQFPKRLVSYLSYTFAFKSHLVGTFLHSHSRAVDAIKCRNDCKLP